METQYTLEDVKAMAQEMRATADSLKQLVTEEPESKNFIEFPSEINRILIKKLDAILASDKYTLEDEIFVLSHMNFLQEVLSSQGEEGFDDEDFDEEFDEEDEE